MGYRAFWLVIALLAQSAAAAPQQAIVFDFESDADVNAWKNVDVNRWRQIEMDAHLAPLRRAATNPTTLPAVKPALPAEPTVKITRATEHATSGRHSLQMTFTGGRFPTIGAAPLLVDWTAYKTIRADITASRVCMVVFRIMREGSVYSTEYNDAHTRWEIAFWLQPGSNSVAAALPVDPKYKAVTGVEISMYQPHEGETIFVDNIQLDQQAVPQSPYLDADLAPAQKYKVLGTELTALHVNDLAEQLKATWTPPKETTVQEIEADMREQLQKLRAEHPRAVLAILRDGEKGFDSAAPDKAYAGWQDAATGCHAPMALTLGMFRNFGKAEDIECCFRRRPCFFRVDVSAIPGSAQILAARLVLVRGIFVGKNNSATRPTMFVAEPCKREWNEYEVNPFEAAHDQFWGQFAGMSWDGPDPDCDNVFLMHGPSADKVCSWDFAAAVRYWHDDGHPNHGFILYGSPKYVDYLHVHSRESETIGNRPALIVIYEPREGKAS